MNPTRYVLEEEYYDRIVEKYRKMVESNENFIDAQTFVATELITLMDELTKENPNSKLQMNQIAQNIMILLLSLFEQKDVSTEYKSYADLDDGEKNALRRELIPVCIGITPL